MFLPVTLAGFFANARRGARPAVIWLGFASLFFYAWWDYRCLPLLLASILLNYLAARMLGIAAMDARFVAGIAAIYALPTPATAPAPPPTSAVKP